MEGVFAALETGFHSWRLHLDGASVLKQLLEQEWQALQTRLEQHNASQSGLLEALLADCSDTAEKVGTASE